jgi:dienelactone hydrolase
MVETRIRLRAAALCAAVAGIVLSGCEASQDGSPMPPPPSQVFKAEFVPTVGRMPYPIDLYFNGPGLPDGTLAAIPSSAAGFPRSPAVAAAMNSLDGFSTTADITASFNQPIRADSLTAANVRIIEMYLSNTTKGPAQGAELPPGVTSPVIRVLANNVDFALSVSPTIDSEGRFLRITPLKPLRPSTGATNIGYLIALTNGILDTEGRQAQPDDLYAAIKSAPADCSSFTDPTQNGVCRLVKGQLAVLQATGLSPSNVVLSWSFTTQSTDDTLAYLAAAVPGPTPTVINIGRTTKDINAALAGKANVYTGAMSVPYYLTAAANPNDTAVLTRFWTAAGASTVPGLDPASRNLTRFNPIPAVTSTQRIPLLVTVPNATAAGGACVKPTAGWPAVIVMHGLGGDRSTALAMADSYADACHVIAAIDMPLHGLTPTTGGALFCSATNPICAGARERTFDVDLINNTTGAAGPDGIIDTSGAHIINLTSPLTSRDNLRQGEADLILLYKALAKLDLNGDSTADIDPARIHYTGISMGGIVGAAVAKFSPGLKSATLSVPGGVITKLLQDSPSLSGRVTAGVSASLAKDTYAYDLFFRDVQAAIDAGDPINHIAGAVAARPVYLQKVVGDTVVPNSATDRLILAGNMRKVSSGAANVVAPGNPAHVVFPFGHHGSLFTPAPCSSFPASAQALCVATTTEMQRQAVLLAASGFLTVSNPNVTQP